MVWCECGIASEKNAWFGFYKIGVSDRLDVSYFPLAVISRSRAAVYVVGEADLCLAAASSARERDQCPS